MPWEPWQHTEQRTLARYANSQSVKLLPRLASNPGDLRADREGKRKTLELIYNVLSATAILYDIEPPNLQDERQVIRQPADILGPPHQATCLDLALLFGGLCLHFDLIPLLVLMKQHALLAVSTKLYQREVNSQHRDELLLFEQGLMPTAKGDALRDLIHQQQYIALECTGIAYSEALSASRPEGRGRVSGRMSFERALVAGTEQLTSAERPFLYALDVVEVQRTLKPYPIDLPSPSITFIPGRGENPILTRTPSSSTSLVTDLKRKTLTQRIAYLTEEYEAITQQVDITIDPVVRLRLLRQADTKIAEIDQYAAELRSL